MDSIIRATAAEGMVRAFATRTTDLVEAARMAHQLEPAASAALGRTMTAVAMMTMDLKHDAHTVSASVKGNGTIGTIMVVGQSQGRVKGYVGNPAAETRITENGKIDVAHAIGNEATLTIVKDLGMRQPYSAQIYMPSREIAEDFAYYFAVSEQKPSAVGLGVLVDVDNHIIEAGGFIIQPMPGASEELLSKIEHQIAHMEPVSTQLKHGGTPQTLLESALGAMKLHIYEEIVPRFYCNCDRDRLSQIIRGIDKKELKEMVEQDHQIEIACHYCGKKYLFHEEELMAMLNAE